MSFMQWGFHNWQACPIRHRHNTEKADPKYSPDEHHQWQTDSDQRRKFTYQAVKWFLILPVYENACHGLLCQISLQKQDRLCQYNRVPCMRIF